MLSKYQIEKIFHYFSQTIIPKSDLIYDSDFELLVAVILSAQATDKGVNKVTRVLFPIANTPEKILGLGYDGLENLIKSIGLYKSKAKNIYKTCQILIDKHASKVPDNRNDLEALPGVGQKTASVVLNIAFGHETLAVDTHVFRVSNRLGLVETSSPEKTEAPLIKQIPSKYKKDAHHYLILHGRYVCTARNPKCTDCQIRKYCKFFNQAKD